MNDLIDRPQFHGIQLPKYRAQTHGAKLPYLPSIEIVFIEIAKSMSITHELLNTQNPPSNICLGKTGGMGNKKYGFQLPIAPQIWTAVSIGIWRDSHPVMGWDCLASA